MGKAWFIQIIASAALLRAAEASELNQFRMRTFNATGDRCLQVDSAKMAVSSLGQIWVSDDATVTISGAGPHAEWKSVRVVIDLKHHQVVIEEFKKTKLIETVIKLRSFDTQKVEIVL